MDITFPATVEFYGPILNQVSAFGACFNLTDELFGRVWMFFAEQMSPHMVIMAQNYKILCAVVIFYSVYMMNNFTVTQKSANIFFHYKDVLKDILAFWICPWVSNTTAKNVSRSRFENPCFYMRLREILDMAFRKEAANFGTGNFLARFFGYAVSKHGLGNAVSARNFCLA
jgi:hypothetical protein